MRVRFALKATQSNVSPRNIPQVKTTRRWSKDKVRANVSVHIWDTNMLHKVNVSFLQRENRQISFTEMSLSALCLRTCFELMINGCLRLAGVAELGVKYADVPRITEDAGGGAGTRGGRGTGAGGGAAAADFISASVAIGFTGGTKPMRRSSTSSKSGT